MTNQPDSRAIPTGGVDFDKLANEAALRIVNAEDWNIDDIQAAVASAIRQAVAEVEHKPPTTTPDNA